MAAGLVRCLTAGSNGYWVAAGHSSGILSLIDLRTGMLLSSWKGHEGEVLQVRLTLFQLACIFIRLVKPQIIGIFTIVASGQCVDFANWIA